MKKTTVLDALKSVKSSIGKHSPEILTAIGIAGMITTAVLAVKATPKALELIEEAKHDKEDKVTPIEKVKVAWKPYVPAVVTGVVSTTCLIGATSVSTRRTAALATAYKISETALKEFKEKTVEVVGENKVKEIKEKIAKENVDKNPVSKTEVIITERGNTLCYDATFGRYFRSDRERIKQAFNEINRRLILDMYVSLNEFYDELGLDHIDIGDELGWNIDNGTIYPDFSSQIADDGTPCLVIRYSLAPRYSYSDLC